MIPLTRHEVAQMVKLNPFPTCPSSAQERDRQLVREATQLVQDFMGTLRPRPILAGINDGSDEERDFLMTMQEDPREEVEEAHRQGKHRPPHMAKPKLDCPMCQGRLAAFRRRRYARDTIVPMINRGLCKLCHEPVTPRAARFVNLRGGRCRITQMFQYSHAEIEAELNAGAYTIICPACSRKGGRAKLQRKEAEYIPIGITPRKVRVDKKRAK